MVNIIKKNDLTFGKREMRTAEKDCDFEANLVHQETLFASIATAVKECANNIRMTMKQPCINVGTLAQAACFLVIHEFTLPEDSVHNRLTEDSCMDQIAVSMHLSEIMSSDHVGGAFSWYAAKTGRTKWGAVAKDFQRAAFNFSSECDWIQPNEDQIKFMLFELRG